MKHIGLYFEQLEQTYEQIIVNKSNLHFIALPNITFQTYHFYSKPMNCQYLMKPNDLKEGKRKPKNLIVRKDLKEIGYNKKLCGSHKHAKLQYGSNEFIVDWQIPKSELSQRQTAKHQ